MSATGVRIYYPRCYAVLSLLLDGGHGDSDTLALERADRTTEDEDDEEEKTPHGDEQIDIPIIPKEATIHFNSYSKADSYDLTFDAADLPIDPDDIRAAAVSLYLYQTPSLDKGSFAIVRPDDDGFAGADKPQLRIAGLIDEPQLQLSAQGKFVTVRGQDYTAYLAGRQWPPTDQKTARRIPVGKPLDVTLREIITMADPLKILTLHIDDNVKKIPTVTPQVNAEARGIPIEQKTSYWDVMYKLALRCGMIIYVRGTTVVLSAPHNLDQIDYPRIRRFGWGANIESLDLTRRMGRLTTPTVVMRGVRMDGKIVEVQYPPARQNKASLKLQQTAGAKKAKHVTRIKTQTTPAKKKPKLKALKVHERDEYEIIPAGNIADPKVLADMAEVRFRLLSHGTRKVVLKTQHLRDFRESLTDPDGDLLTLNSGDAVSIDFRDYNAEYIGNDNIPPETRIAYLTRRGYKPEVARMLVRYHDKIRMLRRPLRIKEGSYRYSGDKGIAIELQLESYMQTGAIAAVASAVNETTNTIIGAMKRALGGKLIGQ